MKKITKRFFDISISAVALIFFSPLLVFVSTLVFLQDFENPFYISERVGKNKKIFKMIKIRTMIYNADKTGVYSTSASDQRITYLGKLIRKTKLDELSQLINVLYGNMSLVGPRPNVIEEVELYSNTEKKLLIVKPGITDFASIVFSDEAEIIKDSLNPDLKYNQLIRPGKSYLGLFYIEKMNIFLDIFLCFLTVIAIFSKKISLKVLNKLLLYLNADQDIISIASREKELIPMPPPGKDKVVSSR